MKTGYFKQIIDVQKNGFISISLYPSNNEFVNYEYKSLAPNWKLYENLKSKKISEDQFITAYKEQLESMNPNKVYDDLNTFLNFFEHEFKTKVIICAHPKSNSKNDYLRFKKQTEGYGGYMSDQFQLSLEINILRDINRSDEIKKKILLDYLWHFKNDELIGDDIPF